MSSLELKYTHENSLMAPHDKSGEPRPSTVNHPTLSNSETVAAMEELNVNEFTHKFRRVERKYADPAVDLQKIGLVSFIPCKGAVPDEKGIFGFVKLRGNFETAREADERAEYLIKNHDSYHSIQHVYVGRPFPLMKDTKDFIKNVNEIDVIKHEAKEISAEVKAKRDKEQKEISEIKERSKNLQKEVDREGSDPEEIYTTLRTKKAQLVWTYLETQSKLEQMKKSIISTREEIRKAEEEDSNLPDIFYDKWKNAREAAGISNDPTKLENSFMIYLIEDGFEKLGF